MATNFNFKNFGSNPTGDGNGRPPGNFPLTRQPSIYSLTFDELQSTMGGSLGKDFGSMNMDELLKNIWNAEETQTMMGNPSLTSGTEGIGAPPSGNLQRQGSLTLPRTLSQKTVDEVWKDISKDGTGNGSSSLPQRQQTLGEMTLEEFLFRAGVVREDTQLEAKPGGSAGNGGFLGNTGMGIAFQQTGGGTGLMGSRIPESNNQFSIQSSNLPLNVNGVRSDQTQLSRPQQPQIYPKPVTVTYGAHPMPQLGSPGMRGGMVGMADQGLSSGLVQSAALQGGGMGMAGLGAGAGGVGTGSPANHLSSDGLGKSNGDMSSVSPVPYGFNGGFRGRRSSGSVEKVVERRQRRMIKNRESAARSRARKQAYTMELEAEVAKLKEENQELQKKQAEILEMQKNQVLEMMNIQRGVKKQCLRKSQSGPW